MRLYVNQDAGNVLWEYAFERFILIPGPLTNTDDPILYVTADDAATQPQIIHGFTLGPQRGQSEPPYSINWQVQGDGTLDATQQSNRIGQFTTQLQLSPITGSTANVRASINDSGNAWFQSATFQVTPGKPAHIIDVRQSGSTVLGGLGEINLQADIIDAYGNAVADGTPVLIQADDLSVTGPRVTQGGKVHLALTGGGTPGTKTVKLQAGDAQTQLDVVVHDIDLTFQSPGVVPTDTNMPVMLTASSSYGDLNGLTVHLASHRGKLAEHFVTLNNGVAQTSLYTGDFRGAGTLVAKIGERVYTAPFEVEESDEDALLLDPVVVKSVAPGSLTVGGKTIEYTNQTQFRVKGTPGTQVQVSVGSYLQPPIRPMLSYPFDEPAPVGVVSDRSGRFDGRATQVELVQEAWSDLPDSYHFTSQSQVTTANASALRNTGNLGFTVMIKPDAPGVVVDFQASQQQLVLEANLRLTYRITTDQGTFSLTTDAPLTAQQWVAVGAHYHESQLILQVDQNLKTRPASGALLTQSGGQGLVIAGSGFQGHLAQFRLYDWSNQPFLSFADGTLSKSLEVEPDGFAKVMIKASVSAVLMFEQRYGRPPRPSVTPLLDFFFASAYANTPTDCNVEPENPELVLSRAEALLEAVLQCVVQRQIDKTVIRYETAQGFKEKTLAAIELATYRTIYSQLYIGGKGLIAALECLDGVITGNPQTGTAMLCDFISGLFLIGDVRDLLYQGYYFFIDDEENFSPMVATFAGLGIFGSAVSVTGAGATVGVTLAGAKMIPKAFKNAAFVKHLGQWIDKRVLVGDVQKGAQELDKVMPLLQITAFVAFMGFSEEFKPTRQFLTEAIEDADDVEAWIGTLQRYFAFWEDAPKVVHRQEEVQSWLIAALDFLVASAEAARIDPADMLGRPAREFLDQIQRIMEMPGITKSDSLKAVLPQMFNKVIKELAEQVGENSAKKISAIEFTDPAMRSMIVVYAVGGENSLKRFRNYQGVAPDSTDVGIEKMLELISEIDVSQLTQDQAHGLAKIFNRFDTNNAVKSDDAHNKASGATHELLEVIAIMRDPNRKLDAIQPDRLDIYNAQDVRVGGRDYDYIEDGKRGDKKARDPEAIKKKLGSEAKVGSDDTAGQLFLDAVDIGMGGKPVVWSFDRRALALGEQTIKKMAVDAIERNQSIFRLQLGIPIGPGGNAEWAKFVERFKNIFLISVSTS